MSVIGHLLKDICSIRSYVKSGNRGHGVWADGTDVPCAFVQREGRIVKDSDGKDQTLSGIMFLGLKTRAGDDTAIDQKDRILFDGQSYGITSVKRVHNIRGVLTHFELPIYSVKN